MTRIAPSCYPAMQKEEAAGGHLGAVGGDVGQGGEDMVMESGGGENEVGEEAAWAGREGVCAMHFFETANGIRTRHTEGAFNASCPKLASISTAALNSTSIIIMFGY